MKPAHIIDPGDLAYARHLGLDFVDAWPVQINATRFLRRDGQVTDAFNVGPAYYEALDGSWRPLSEIATQPGNRFIALHPRALERMSPRFFLWLCRRQREMGSRLIFHVPGYAGAQPEDLLIAATGTARPDRSDLGGSTQTVDGHVETAAALGGPTTWAGAHAASVGTSASYAGSSGICRSDLNTGTSSMNIDRSFLLFNTYAANVGGTITAATMSVTASTANSTDNDGDDWINVVQTTPASDTVLAIGDFQNCGAVTNPTEGSTRKLVAAFTADSATYNDFVLNATGLGWIPPTGGITRLGLREGHDALDSSVLDTKFVQLNWLPAEGGTSTGPKLAVTFTPDDLRGQILY